jgi:hypothetical protein
MREHTNDGLQVIRSFHVSKVGQAGRNTKSGQR